MVSWLKTVREAKVEKILSYSCPKLDITDTTCRTIDLGRVIEQIIDNELSGRTDKEGIMYADRNIERMENENVEMAKRLGRPFEFDKELSDAKKLVDEYTQKMKEEMDEKEKKYSQRGTGKNVDINNVDDEETEGETEAQLGTLPYGDLDEVQQLAYDAVREALTLANVDVNEVDEDTANNEFNSPLDAAEFQIVSNEKAVEKLNNDPKGYVEAYCTMAKIDGKYYSPMATFVREEGSNTKVLSKPIAVGDWMKSEERPSNDPNVRVNENGKWEYHLIKPDGDMWVAYDPYWHSTTSPLNDQFTSAWNRPELVTVKVRIPVSDIQSGYQAEGALLPVGEHDWNKGRVSAALTKHGKTRRVILSQYRQIVEEVPVEQEAKNIAETLIEGNTILLNFENVDVAVSQRVIDIVTGTCIAIKGNIQRISNYIFIATPSTVDVLGTATETLAGSFDSL